MLKTKTEQLIDNEIAYSFLAYQVQNKVVSQQQLCRNLVHALGLIPERALEYVTKLARHKRVAQKEERTVAPEKMLELD